MTWEPSLHLWETCIFCAAAKKAKYKFSDDEGMLDASDGEEEFKPTNFEEPAARPTAMVNDNDEDSDFDFSSKKDDRNGASA